MDELDELDVGVEEAGASVVAVVDEVAPDADEVDSVDEVDWVEADFGAVDVAVTDGRGGGRRGVVGGRGLGGQGGDSADAQGGHPGDHAGGPAAAAQPSVAEEGRAHGSLYAPRIWEPAVRHLGPGTQFVAHAPRRHLSDQGCLLDCCTR